MAWKTSKTTRHTCGGPAFGRKTAGCPRCDELLAGAEPVQWNSAQRSLDIQARRLGYSATTPHHAVTSGTHTTWEETAMIGDHITTSLRAASDLSRVLARLEAHAYESRTPVAKKDAGRKGTR